MVVSAIKLGAFFLPSTQFLGRSFARFCINTGSVCPCVVMALAGIAVPSVISIWNFMSAGLCAGGKGDGQCYPNPG